MLISIEENDSRPLYQQIVYQIKEQVADEALKAGDELPSVRDLSDNLGINMHTVRRAYLELRDQGIIVLRLGRKAKIANIRQISPGTDKRSDIEIRFGEVITDALLAGLSTDEIRKLVNEHLEK